MRYRKKPIVIEAHQWFKNGDHPLDDCRTITPIPIDGAPFQSEGEIVRYYRHPNVGGDEICVKCGSIMHDHGWLDTLECGHTVCVGDFIIKGIAGELYPCKPDIFEKTYEKVD